MSAFQSEWLRLREPADRRARNGGVAQAVAGWFALREKIHVVDFGAGTGANLRATAGLLPARQSWLLIDNDAAMLAAARLNLSAWAESAVDVGETLNLTKNGATIAVEFKQLDLARDLDRALETSPDLVTASAFFDLVSPPFIADLAHKLAARRAAFYGVLTYNGVERWSPHRPADSQITAAFLRHQLGDKGFGPAAGAMAADHLNEQFRLDGYTVLEGESPWDLGSNDRSLIEELISGHAMVALESQTVRRQHRPHRYFCDTGLMKSHSPRLRRGERDCQSHAILDFCGSMRSATRSLRTNQW
jgi:hypothetical protein